MTTQSAQSASQEREAVAYLYHFRKIGGGARYVEAQVGFEHSLPPHPQDGFEYVRKEPLGVIEDAPQKAAGAPDATATESGARWQADQHLRALLRYTENFYGTAIAHGMKAGPTANAISHVERAAKALHALVHAWADAAEARAAQPAAVQQGAGPVGFMSPKQLPRIKDPEGEFGCYIPMRKTPAGLFTLALYASPPPAALADANVAALGYAKNLATAIHAKHYPEVTQWQPLDTVLGLLTQIDNMTCGLVQPISPPAPPAVPGTTGRGA